MDDFMSPSESFCCYNIDRYHNENMKHILCNGVFLSYCFIIAKLIPLVKRQISLDIPKEAISLVKRQTMDKETGK